MNASADVDMPSADPGGVSSFADVDADADADALSMQALYRLEPGMAVGATIEAVEAMELDGALMLMEDFCWCDFGGRVAFMVMGVLVLEDEGMSSSVGLLGVEVEMLPLRWCEGSSKLEELSSCSTSSSHFTLREEEGRSARSARLRQSWVRWCRLTQRVWNLRRSPSEDIMFGADAVVFSSHKSTSAAKLRAWSIR